MSKEQEKEIELHMKEMLDSGYKIHVPHLHTVQKDLFGGYAICYENASAIASSSAVHIYYDKQSRGSMFDLGVAYYLNKELVLVNEDQITFDNNDFGDNIVRNWNKKGMVKTYR